MVCILIFLEPIFKIIGLSVFKFSIFMSLLSGASFLCLYLSIRKVIANQFLGFLGFLTTVYFNLLIYVNGWNNEPYYQFLPLRFFFPCLITYLVILFFEAPRAKSPRNLRFGFSTCVLGRRLKSAIAKSFLLPQLLSSPIKSDFSRRRIKKQKNRWLFFLIAFLCSISVLWNMDTGVVVFVSWILTLLYSAFNSSKTPKLVTLLSDLFLNILIFLVVILLFCLFIFIRSGHFPDFSQLFIYVKIFYGSGFYMLPIPLLGSWSLIILVYMVGLAMALGKYNPENKTNSYKNTLIFFLSILGLGVFSYYQGRSHYYILPLVTYPAFILLTIYGDQLLSNLKKYNVLLAHKVLFFLILISIFSFSLINLSDNRLAIKSNLNMGINALNQPPIALKDGIDFISKNVQKNERIMVISNFSAAVYYGETQTASALDLPSLTETFLKKDRDAMIHFLNQKSQYKIFLDNNMLTVTDRRNFLADFIQKNITLFDILATSKNGQMSLVTRK